jgi:hypothetical protein
MSMYLWILSMELASSPSWYLEFWGGPLMVYNKLLKIFSLFNHVEMFVFLTYGLF